MKLNIWQEKYRPKTISDVILSEENRKSFQQFINEGEIPHLILSGPPGVGKTTMSKILIRSLDCDRLILNGSDSRGLDVIRNQISDFTAVIGLHTWKIVFYDEGENLTPDAWKALKGIIEKHSKRARFIFTTNFLYKVPEAIKSRCQIFNFIKIPKDDIIEHYEFVLNKEKIGYTDKQLAIVHNVCNGDLRRSLNYLQKHSVSGQLVLQKDEYSELFNEIKSSLKNKEVKNLKEYFATHSIEWEALYRYLYDRTSEVVKLATIGKYFISHSQVVDPEINFVCMVCELIQNV